MLPQPVETSETRVFQCPCGKILQLVFTFENSELYHIETSNDNTALRQEKRYGRRRIGTPNGGMVKMQTWTQRLWVIGRTIIRNRARPIKLVSCKGCSRKHGWKKFVKLDL